jgi:hypothetical protein
VIIKFSLEVWCGNDEPHRFVYQYRGEILDWDNDDDDDYSEPHVKIGEIHVFYCDRVRALHEGESLFEAMDDTGSGAMACYEALIDQETGDLKDEVKELIGEDALVLDNILLIERLEIDERFRGKGIGAKVFYEVLKTFGSQCAVIAGKPFPLQYQGYLDPENEADRKEPGSEQKRRAAFRKVTTFWKNLGFRKLPSSEFYVRAYE